MTSISYVIMSKVGTKRMFLLLLDTTGRQLDQAINK